MATMSEITESGRNVFTLLRDALLFLILLMLVGCPAEINNRLKATGLVALEGPGFKWEKEIEDAKAEAEAVQEQVQEAKLELEDTITKLEAVEQRNPAIRAETAQILQDARMSSEKLEIAQDQIASSIQRQDVVLKEIESERSRPSE